MAGVQFKQLAHAVSPSIYGHELLKAGILLALLGGVRKGGNDPGSTSVPLRGDIHVLLVGDPGLGKSQLLQVVKNSKMPSWSQPSDSIMCSHPTFGTIPSVACYLLDEYKSMQSPACRRVISNIFKFTVMGSGISA